MSELTLDASDDHLPPLLVVAARAVRQPLRAVGAAAEVHDGD